MVRILLYDIRTTQGKPAAAVTRGFVVRVPMRRIKLEHCLNTCRAA